MNKVVIVFRWGEWQNGVATLQYVSRIEMEKTFVIMHMNVWQIYFH